MKCNKCGFENSNNAKFCTKCGSSLVEVNQPPAQKSNNNVIYALLIVIIILVAVIGYFAINFTLNDSRDVNENQSSQSAPASQESSSGESSSSSSGQSSSSASTSQGTSSSSESKSWVPIGSYSGSGSGSQSVTVPPGQIMIKISAYPIKNYATNHLYVTGSNGQSAGVDWGPKSDVETRSDSLTYTSSNTETFTIDYYETVSWEVEFYRYQ